MKKLKTTTLLLAICLSLVSSISFATDDDDDLPCTNPTDCTTSWEWGWTLPPLQQVTTCVCNEGDA